MTIFSNALKAISVSDDELRVGNYILLFGGRDLEFVRMGPNPDKSLGTRFAETVEVESDFTKSGRLPLGWEHGTDPDKAGIRGPLGWVDWTTAKRDEKGVFVERVLNRRNKYVQFVQALIEAGLIGTSSEAVPDGIRALEDGTIVAWPLRGDTLTVMPVEPRMMAEFGANQLQAVKALQALAEDIPAVKGLLKMFETQPDSENGEGDAHAGDPAGPQPAVGVTHPPSTITKEKKAMNLMDAIKKLVPGLSEEQYQQLGAILSLAGYSTAESADPSADPEAMRSLDITKLIGDLKSLGYTPVAPGVQPTAPAPEATQPGKAITRPPYEFRQPQAAPEQTNGQKAMEAAYLMRFGEEDASKKAIMTDYIGPNYRQVIYEQNIAYAKFLRGGERALDQREFKALKVLYFPTSAVFDAVRDGATVGSIKATQVEAAGELGGFAIPPNSQSEIAKRAAGLTVVRAAGARVIQLVNSNGVEIPIYRGNSKRYMGLIRGQWGTETQAPSDQNFKMDLELVMANVYTYKVPMSVSMIEDAANLVALVDEDIASTKAVDEDTCFLIGDGVGKPRGCLPGGVNADGLTEVVTGAAGAFTPGGITRLKRALPSQYRDKTKTVFVANSASYGAIEELTVGGGNLARAFPELGERDELRGYRAWESEAMPDVAASAYPLLYANMGGYTIVERLGMTIERFKDSGTGINKVEFHVRARVGGRIERPWLFTVQKVSAA
jgi:HK97 family phage major capsid protein